MRIAVYPGTFDPLHTGHLAILEYLTGTGDFDMVYLVVSPRSPFKDASRAANALQRLEAARLAVARHPGLKVKVDDTDFKLPQPNFTITTLRTIREREPENSFSLVIGADNLAEFHKWKDWQEILLEFGLVVYPRPGYPAVNPELGQFSERIHVIDAPMVDISSTFLREAASRGEDIRAYLM